jgi:hypothetical protein
VVAGEVAVVVAEAAEEVEAVVVGSAEDFCSEFRF